MEQMVELIKYIACSLVEKPEEVDVRLIEGEEGPVIELRVAHSDIGKVIGRQGRIAKAIRCVLKAACAKTGETVTLEII